MLYVCTPYPAQMKRVDTHRPSVHTSIAFVVGTHVRVSSIFPHTIDRASRAFPHTHI